MIFPRLKSNKRIGRASSPRSFQNVLLVWLATCALCAVSVLLSYRYLDMPLAHRVHGILVSSRGLATGLGSTVLLGIEGFVVLSLIVERLLFGRLSRFHETTALACLCSICVYAINDGFFKPIFGVPTPSMVFAGARHSVHWLELTAGGSFPSGHMVLASGFAGVFARTYRNSILPFGVLLLFAACLLIVGEWHFLSDVIAGTFIGMTAGLLAAELWSAHSAR